MKAKEAVAGFECAVVENKPVAVILLCITMITSAMLAGSCNTPAQEPTTQQSPPQSELMPPSTSEPEPKEKEYVRYAGYGSNLCQERFFCYIQGGQYELGGSYAPGCKDRTLPQENKTIELPYRLYFARESSSWGQGGVAFISVDKEEDQEKWTLARMWKITEEQFEQVRQQEGTIWYNRIIDLGMDEGIPVLTITNNEKQPLNPPSHNYLTTIVIGLRESYQMDANEVYNYLCKKEGIQGYFSEAELRNIIERSFNAGK